ncbi:MAG: cation diffusion facilitator family transporter [Bdellovibrionota bacterium]
MSGACTDQRHDHQHDHSSNIATGLVFKIAISLNLIFVFVEIYFGLLHHSLALVSDGIHNLTDVFGLIIAWMGYILSKRKSTKKLSIYAAVINTSLLLISSVWIIFEAYERYFSDQAPVASTVIVVASMGFVVNLFTARLFHKGHQDLNIKSAYLHLMADAAISLGVVVTGIVIYYTNVFWIDPVVSAVISVIIIFSAWKYFKESVVMLMGKTPLSINIENVKKSILLQAEVAQITQIKVWALSTSENALIAQIQTSKELSEKQIKDLKHRLFHEFKITSVDFIVF